jgi:HAD superfamily hydrolase (TIGR01509 family)
MLRGRRLVVFDFDGTLFDVSDAICHGFNEALRRRGRAPLPRERIHAWIGRPLIEMFALEDPAASDDVLRASVETYREVFHPIAVGLSRALPGLRECLDELGSTHRFAIVTNRARRGAKDILVGHGLLDRFDPILGIDDVQRVKPHPEPVLAAMRHAGAGPDETVMVGDTADDIRAGLAAGTAAVGVTTGFTPREALAAAGAHAVIASLAELPALLKPR